MALGYETNSTAPNLIANAGNAMAADIRKIGETIRKDIQQHNTDKQVFGFLQEAKSLDPSAPTFQNDLVGVFAKYPAAAADQRALTGAKLLHDQWSQVQLTKKMQSTFENQKTLEGIRHPKPTPYGGLGAGLDSANSPLGVPPPELPTGEGGADPTNELMQGVAPLAGVLRSVGAEDNFSRKLVGQAAKEMYVGKQRAASKPNVKLVDGNLHQINPDGSTKLLIQKDPRSKGFYMAPEGAVQLMDNGQFKLPDGSLSDTAPAGITRVPGAMDEANAEARKAASEEHTATKVTDRAISIINSTIKEKDTQLKSLGSRINKTRDILDKAETPDPAKLTELAMWQKQHGELQAEIAGLQKDRDEMGTAKQLDKDTAAELLREAGGDKEKARELARSRGYKL